jgi:GNAT superfamily N-acetyltransferase
VFKLLRNTKLLDKLKDTEVSLYDKTVSINESIDGEIEIQRDIFDKGIRFYAVSGGQKLGKISLNREFVTGYYTIVAFQIFDKSMRHRGIGRKLMNAVLADKEIMKKPILVQPFPYASDSDIDMKDLVDMYSHFGFRDWEGDKHFMIYDKHLNESLRYDQKDGVGAVPWNQDVDYRGFKKMMTPGEFLKLALPLYDENEVDRYIDYIEVKGLASPWLEVEWREKNNFWRVVGHEGRHRMAAIKRAYPGQKVEVHVFPRGMRARDLTPEMINAPMVKQLK